MRPLPEFVMGNKGTTVFLSVNRWQIDHEMTNVVLYHKTHCIDVHVRRIVARPNTVTLR